MPRSPSPAREPRRRSPSPRRERDRDADADRRRERDRSPGRDHKRDDRDRDRDYARDRERRRDRDRDRDGDRDRRERNEGRSDRERHRERSRDDVDSPRRQARDSDRDRDRDRDLPPRRTSRSPSPSSRPTSSSYRKPKAKELSFYKKSSGGGGRGGGGSMGSFSHRRDPLDAGMEESAKERMERRERGEVPARFGGTREQGVRNTMSSMAPQGTSSGVGSFKRGGDPLDRMPNKDGAGAAGGRGDGDRMMQERVAAMAREGGGNGTGPAAGPGAGPPSGIPTPRGSRMIEVIANDRMGRKVRVKCLPTDTVGDLKKLIAAQTGTIHQKIQLKKWYTVYKDHVSLRDYEINDGMSLEMY